MNDYLEKVLNSWTEFCKGHRLFTEALKELVDENKELREEVKKLKSESEKNLR